MKHLPKHLRPRYRYLALHLETLPDASFGRHALQEAIWGSSRRVFGDIGSAAIDSTVVRFTHADGVGEAIIRVRRGEVDRARAAITCIARIGGNEVGLRIAGVSGTIRACEEKYMGGGPKPQCERTVAFGNAERTAFVRDGLVDVKTDDAFAGATDFDLRG